MHNSTTETRIPRERSVSGTTVHGSHDEHDPSPPSTSKPNSPARTLPPPLPTQVHKHTRVQFPEDLATKAGFNHPAGATETGGLPYPFIRQDSEFGSRPGSIAGTDDEDSEDYDWSDEDDLVDEAAKFEGQMGHKPKREGFSFKRLISLLFTSLIGSTFLAAVLVAPALLVHFYWYKPHPTDHRRFVKSNLEAWLFWAAAQLIISWFLAMIIDIIPIIIRFFIALVWGHVSESVKTRLETYSSVKDTAKPAFYAGSAYASWAIIFGGIYDLYNADKPEESRAPYMRRTAQVVQFFFFLILVWSIQKMLSHFIAFSFHRTAYQERIESVEKALSVIEKLRQYRPKPHTTHHTPRPRSSGARTPVFGLQTPFSEKQHFRALSGALRTASLPVSRSDTAGYSLTDDGHEGDSEGYEGDRTLVDKKKKRRSKLGTWFGHDEGQKTSATSSYENTPISEKDTNGIHGNDSLTPLPPARPKMHSRQPSEPHISSHLNPHRYPPSHTPSAKNSPVEAGISADETLRQAARVLKNAVMHDARNLSGTAGELGAGLSWDVGSAHEAKRLARSIYMRFKAPGRTWLIPSDFLPAYNDQDKASEAFKVFDKDNNNDISRAEVKTAVLKVYKERRFLSRSMRDVSQALQTLNRIMLFFAAVVVFFISLSVFGVEIGSSLTSVYSLGIAASFIFKNAASNAFDAIMFLFVMHPYDTGDRVFVDEENLVVKKVGLFATVFQRSDGTETYYFNSQLFTKFITNARRSGKTFENLTMQVAWTTPLTKLDALEKCMNDWLSTEENRWFEPSTNITLQHIKFQRYLELTIGIGHNGNWQDWGLRLARKTAFHAAVQYYSRELGIIGWEAPLPIVYADPKTKTYQPSAAHDDAFLSMMDPDDLSAAEQQSLSREETLETEKAAQEMKPTLGFLPPLGVRSNHLLRARKSRNRKANLGAGNAG
ncbi:Mechanosensitive ion channel-domain-containing protein [Crepidotus variabilis]|uniref:Mechanosensitive ion channel-domain-containing protein n=1 Tax=Crepidotus variabilis TaxID=179855 RepID=A0A9P6JWH9_9AGAR|nr:Mechanosensitive ion channel-domain-containing protein [Crepidotus variabilis]